MHSPDISWCKRCQHRQSTHRESGCGARFCTCVHYVAPGPVQWVQQTLFDSEPEDRTA